MTGPAVTTRRATEGDAPALARLLRTLGALGEVDAAEAARRLEDRHEDVIVACVDGTVSGLVAIKEVLYFGHVEPLAHISALVTDADVRQVGVGTVLVEAAQQWARDRGCVGVELMCGTNPAREAAHRFYHAMGFECIAYVYSMRLPT